jgi:hypothetical protein
MTATVQSFVVRTTAQDKKAIAAKAKRLGIPISELMRRGALAYEPIHSNDRLAALANDAEGAADRACAAIDDALSFIRQSDRRIAAMEAKATERRNPTHPTAV